VGAHLAEKEMRERNLPAESETRGENQVGNAPLQTVPWQDAEMRVRDGLQEAGSADPTSVRFLASAHASVEELFVLRQLVEGLLGADGLSAVGITWARSDKAQRENAKFKVHTTDAPNVNGARDMGYRTGAGNDGAPDLADLRASVLAGRVRALYVLDPGPADSIGDVAWILEARRAGKLPFLAVQAVVSSQLTDAADVVLPGAAFVEKDAVFTNADNRVQAASRAIAPPGDAREDWQILVGVARALGLPLAYNNSADVRRAIAPAFPGTPYESVDRVVFTRPVAASHWLQASNPSERWKWDFMYQDLPPVKGHNVQMEGMPLHGTPYIPLKPVE
jgi:anaerobic selenocysteine-containing dehydrogenase